MRLHYFATVALLFIFFHLGVMETVFHKLSLTKIEVSYAMLLAILLSLVNIQLFKLRPKLPPPRSVDGESGDERHGKLSSAVHVRVGINIGGCIVPLFFMFYLLREHSLEPYRALFLVVLVAAVVYPLSRVEGKVGLVVNLFGAIVSAAIGGIILGGDDYLIWAYMAAVLGTLIGGDLLHLTQLSRMRRAWRQGIFIGGAGLMDAIFLSGLFAMMVAEVVHQEQLLQVEYRAPAPQVSTQLATLHRDSVRQQKLRRFNLES